MVSVVLMLRLGDKSSCGALEWHLIDNRSSTHLCAVVFPINLLSSMRQFDRAALFIEACLKCGVMEANDSSNILFVNPLPHSENLYNQLALVMSCGDVALSSSFFCAGQ